MNLKRLLFHSLLMVLSVVPSTSAQPVVLVSTNSVWRYLDDGSDQGSAWQGLAFDDSGWATGAAPLGYGLSSITTTQAMAKVTYYHRQAFNVPEPEVYSNLVLRVRRDDGAVVYLNDLEIFRSNMPTGSIDFRTEATISATGPTQFNFYTTNVSPELLVAGTNQLAVEIHQGSSNSVDAAFALELVGELDASPPSFDFSSPTNGATYVAGDSVALSASASDGAGIARVEFYADNQPLGTAFSMPYAATFGNVRYGTHTLVAVAQDLAGLRATSAPVIIDVTLDIGSVTLIPNQACWSYWDEGTDPGFDWPALGYDDSLWAADYAELGYGDGDEVTEVGFGGDVNNKYITTYFRHSFSVTDPAIYTNLSLRLKRDDGAVVYLNGTEILRDNLPEGHIVPSTPAVEAADDGLLYLVTNVNPQILRAGENLLAVEVHQSGGASSDLSFDLRLLAEVGIIRPTLSIGTRAAELVLSWPGTIGSDFVLQRTTRMTETPSWENITGIASELREFTFAAGSASSFFRLATTNSETSICQPPLIIAQSSSQSVDAGSSVPLSAIVAGTAPLTYQWFHNAVKIVGATAPTLFLPNVQRSDGGAYDLCVGGPCGFTFTKPIALIVGGGTKVPASDTFAEPHVLSGLAGLLNVDTSSASAETGESKHAHQTPSHSVWFSLTAPVTGIVDLRTDGSSFDTVLAVYRGTNLTTLEHVAENDDGGLKYRSRVRFPALEGDAFVIAVDGYDARSGVVQLDWSVAAGDTSIPVISRHPDDVQVEEGSEATFSVEVSNFTSLQWFHGDQAIVGATTPSFTIPNVSPSDAGSYRLVAVNGVNSVSSLSAGLVVNSGTGQTIGVDGASKPQKCDTEFPRVTAFNGPNGCWTNLAWEFKVGVYDNSTSGILVPAKIRARYCPKPTWVCETNCATFKKALVKGLTSADNMDGNGDYRFEVFRITTSLSYTIYVDFKR